jgi:alkylation response protein AidB-like acyl-CoA dehydrogenase
MSPPRANPLLDDRTVEFLLYEVLDVEALCLLPDFGEHNRHTFDLLLTSARTVARRELFPHYRTIDAAPPVLREGRVFVHPLLKAAWPHLVNLGLIGATRSAEVGGAQLPLVVASLASAYLMAGNLSAYAFVGLTSGAAHLLEAFGTRELRERFLMPLSTGAWTGTMALTEPQAGSSLGDIRTRATATREGHFLIRGEKAFISGAAHDLAPNVVQMVLARIDGAPPGTRGVSLFAVPNRRDEGGTLRDNDVAVTGLVHKIGWRGLPSCMLAFGERGDCHGWLLGEPNRGLPQMFQMMNEARIMVGLNAVATASVAYQEALAYARERAQGRPQAVRDPASPQIPIIDHPDVRRMLLRQKAIVEGGLALLATAARTADLAAHATDSEDRQRARLLLDLLTPVAKSFPAEAGFEATALALQIHGGYGYSSELPPEAWLRDQKLNSLHEGTTGIQGPARLLRRGRADPGAGAGVRAGPHLAGAPRRGAGGAGGDHHRARRARRCGRRGGDARPQQRLPHPLLAGGGGLAVAVDGRGGPGGAAPGAGCERGGLLPGQARRGALLDGHRAAPGGRAGGALPVGRDQLHRDATRLVLRSPLPARLGRHT